MTEGLWRRSPARTDAFALALVTFISALPYVTRLGFYSDDWGLLALFEAAQRQGQLSGFIAKHFIGRPVQGLYLGALFSAFGPDPLGYHPVNTVVIAGTIALFYSLLMRLRLGRAGSFAAALLFALLPQLSTVRVWYSAFQIPLSLALALGSMHLQLGFARSGKWSSLALAAAAALLSIGAYEIFAPLITGFGLGLMLERWKWSKPKLALGAVIVGAVIAGLAYKLAFSGRAGATGDPKRYLAGLRQLVRPDYDWRVDSGLNLIATPSAYFWAPVRGLWQGLWAGPELTAILAAFAVAAITWWRLAGVTDQGTSPRPLLLIGIAAFLLGNAIFLIVPAVVFTSTGIDNRVQVAAALGVAMIFAAVLALAVGRRPELFAATIGLVATLGMLRLAQIERYWAEAPALQRRVLAAASRDLRLVPPGSTVILDGVCPYHGPAVVFEAGWDVAGALTLALGRPVSGDTVSERMRVTPGGLATSIYKEPSLYPYGPRLFVYDPGRHSIWRLGDAQAAARYFSRRGAGHCPAGYVARGVEV